MQLGRKLAEGFAVDLEADVAEQPHVEPAADTVVVRAEEPAPQPTRV